MMVIVLVLILILILIRVWVLGGLVVRARVLSVPLRLSE